MSDQAKRINLSARADWLGFTIGDFNFEVEIFEANDLLAENDRRHFNDPDACLDCAHEFQLPREQRREKENFVCPSCGSTNVLPSQAFLDGVAKIIRERYGAPRCGRYEAGAFYEAIVDAVDAKKKRSSTPPESPSFTTESTLEAGPSPQGGLGLKS